MEFVHRRRLEAVLPVERLCLLILGLNQNGPASDNVRSLRRSQKSVFQERRAEPLALLGAIHSKPGKEENGNGVIRKPLGNARRRFITPH